ncbi:hypothetical protein GWI33_022381 [Rhynchophorus ferrugineus]|uniref:OTU domain-containing protein n=1 Tax=Rhynchophorus ferrugineus TaxID=354439 RepID=A0A834IN96_RHYFE|nr:hypothetical protein GWI33_022381 [Rhynchophorus ferrugineus]
MAGKPSKKGRNPGVVDKWLDDLQLYRKNVAYDETCLFRAVSEQLFECQIFHERVRKDCIDYGRKHPEIFKNLVDKEIDILTHLDLLEKHMVICGNVEIHLISRKYNRDILIFHANKQQVYDVTKLNIKRAPLMLCLMDEDHYDAVYKKHHIETAGFCQSLVYKVLYEEVFKISKVDSIVNAMLYEKTQVISQSELEEKHMSIDSSELLDNTVIAPFPFKVAKALDPTIYRNIEYDSWGEVRRELRLGDWYYGDDKLKMGTRCVLSDSISGELHDCYIQEILKQETKCVVYLTKIAERRIVDYADLSPESDAKPWPLPYRFSKNLVITNTTQLPPMDKIKSMRKKSKEKRQNKNVNDAKGPTNSEADSIDSLSAFVGVPLQMQTLNANTINNNVECGKVEVSTETTGLTLPPSEGLLTPVTPEINHYPQRYQWEPVHWPVPQAQYIAPDSSFYAQTGANPFVWPQGSPAPYYDCKPMVASTPVTPNVVPYHESNYPFYFNYQVEQYPMNSGSPTGTSPSVTPIKSVENNERIVETPQQMVQSPSVLNESTMSSSHCQTMPPQDSVPKMNVAYIPQGSQPMDLYHSVLPVPAGTPIIYAPIPPEGDMMVHTPPVNLYTPTTPVEMQYVHSQGYIYPSGPSIPGYSVYTPPFSYNSQGFVFPQASSPTK